MAVFTDRAPLSGSGRNVESYVKSGMVRFVCQGLRGLKGEAVDLWTQNSEIQSCLLKSESSSTKLFLILESGT